MVFSFVLIDESLDTGSFLLIFPCALINFGEVKFTLELSLSIVSWSFGGLVWIPARNS